MRKNRISVALISVGILLIMAALALVGYNLWDERRAQVEVDKILAQIEPPDTPSIGIEYSGETIPDYVLNPDMDMPTVEIDGYRYIGTVELPSLDLKLPVMETWSYPRLKIAPCRYSGSAYLNNLVICAHNYTSHFGRLKKLQAGAEVIFTDMSGNVFLYKVREIDTLSPTAVEEMQSGGWALTLFTCTVGGRTRVTVRCDLSDSGKG